MKEVICRFCDKKFERERIDSRFENVFCSRSCSAKFNNNAHVKREKKIFNCVKCNDAVRYKRKYCDKCKELKDMTLEEAHYDSKNHYQKFALVRQRARAFYFKNKENRSCEKCFYDKHIEIAHIKPICEFDRSTLISEINKLSNLIGLCPNCHWEFDNLKNK